MHQEIKNQIKNIMSWTRASGTEMSKSLRVEIEQFLGDKGIPMRGPALVALLDSLSPKLSQFILQSFKLATDPMILWLEAHLESIDNNRVELVIEPKPHLIKKEWNPVVFSESAIQVSQVLLERICPPGPLEIRVQNLELQVLKHCKDQLRVRIEIDPIESEIFLKNLILHRQNQLNVIVNLQNHLGCGIAQVELVLEISWSPLVKESENGFA